MRNLILMGALLLLSIFISSCDSQKKESKQMIEKNENKISLSLEVEKIKEEDYNGKIVEYTDSIYTLEYTYNDISSTDGKTTELISLYIDHNPNLKLISNFNESLDDLLLKLNKLKNILKKGFIDYDDEDIFLSGDGFCVRDYMIQGTIFHQNGKEHMINCINYIEKNIKEVKSEFITITERNSTSHKSYKKKM